MDIKIESLKKSYNNNLVVDIDTYTIHSGEILGIAGNNGAGKSTLFRLMLDLTKADTGTVRMGETDVAHSEDWKSWTGAYLDSSFLIDFLTPLEYMSFISELHGCDATKKNNDLQLFPALCNEVCSMNGYIRSLSAGNRQKVGIVASMIARPEVLILDEPFNFLDPSSQIMLKALLSEYNRVTGATVIVSSHNLEHTTDICKRIALMENGHIVQDIDNSNGEAASVLKDYFTL